MAALCGRLSTELVERECPDEVRQARQQWRYHQAGGRRLSCKFLSAAPSEGKKMGEMTVGDFSMRELGSTALAFDSPASLGALLSEVAKPAFECQGLAAARDAACFITWAVARGVCDREVVRKNLDMILRLLICSSLLDPNIIVRRAASAAAQEIVGRLGCMSADDPGFLFVNLVDYWTVANRVHAATTLLGEVASKLLRSDPNLVSFVLEHLYRLHLRSTDKRTRELAARSFIADKLLPACLEETTTHPTIFRHGALLGVSEVVVACEDLVQIAAAEALMTLVACRPSEVTSDEIGKIEKEYIEKLEVADENVAARRGYVLALALITRARKTPPEDPVVSLFVREANAWPHHPISKDLVDAETRRWAVLGLLGVVQSEVVVDAVVETLIRCMVVDYATDSRGDVGRWVREGSVRGVSEVLAGRSMKAFVVDSSLAALISASVSRLDHVRVVAISGIEDIIVGRGCRGGEPFEKVYATVRKNYDAPPRIDSLQLPSNAVTTFELRWPALWGDVLELYRGKEKMNIRHATAKTIYEKSLLCATRRDEDMFDVIIETDWTADEVVWKEVHLKICERIGVEAVVEQEAAMVKMREPYVFGYADFLDFERVKVEDVVASL
ncbi:beta-tubulin cofactor d, putative [Perkinsus marinus ATCC 50983]|uniref:Beta-tubulin cofactor d, putative n=1 Tax=Perkinsus marinus (strain ATCC 50983 / TXsc) TaxID=423536 RepID=C5LFL8_PERM5|nr:beta-tubulin cofactor d, putative [Perkinsus marinus ATCC 50983]EER04470.1 beta-tubulin cofactor d, putative [Perkinsus marinus ATCC 50983]|eukprot:XP_002772654.1 beta-tubulin cofactor d, putative [Perkinsus marinus ATCC 50983]